MADWPPPAASRVEGYWKELNHWRRWGDTDQVGTVNHLLTATPLRLVGSTGAPAHPPATF